MKVEEGDVVMIRSSSDIPAEARVESVGIIPDYDKQGMLVSLRTGDGSDHAVFTS